tara:strand:+ start:432 stop:1337 length:906 start_codon:yes stop_codon:yes gene_type:complete
MFPVNDLTVLIVTFKTNHKILDDCIKSIDGKSKIIIVENSKDEQFKKEYEKKFSNIEVFLSGKNLGYGGGNNFGLNLIKTNYALISNPDVVYEDDFFSSIDYYIKQNVDFDIMGPMYRREDYESHGHFDDLIKISPKSNSSTENSLVSAHWIVGCTMFLNLKKFKNRNLFDENFFLFFEEFDLCRQVILKKGKIYASKKLYVNHLGHKGSAATDPEYSIETEMFRNWHWMWSSFYFYKKNYNFFYAVKSMYGKFFRSLFKMIFFRIFYNEKKFTMYYARFSGILNCFLGKKSWYRVKSLFQ